MTESEMSIYENLSEFVLEPGPEDCLVKCRITRNNKGIDRGIFPTYFLHIDQDNGRRIFLLAGRKRKKCSTSTYLLSTDPTDLSRGGNSAVANVRSNVMGTGFSITTDNRLDFSSRRRSYSLERSFQKKNKGFRSERPCSSSDHSSGHSSEGSCSSSSTCYSSNCMYPQTVQNCYGGPRIVPSTPSYQPLGPEMEGSESGNLGAIMYKPNVLGMRGPRKMKVLIPRPSVDRSTPVFCTGKSLIEKYKQRDTADLILLTSKDAEWDKELKSYVLNYHGRASQASVKNFQICHSSKPDFIIMQLGKIDQDVFNMDFRYPLSALQAFGIALSSFDCKIACE